MISTVGFIHQNLAFLVCHDEQLSYVKGKKVPSLSKAEESLKEPIANAEVESFDPKQFFSDSGAIEEPSSPRKVSPVKKEISKREIAVPDSPKGRLSLDRKAVHAKSTNRD